MKKIIIFLLLAIPLICMAQPALAREYNYDAAGNRILRKVVVLPAPPLLVPPAPPDTLHTIDHSPQTADYFAEKISQVEIKIYPNPTTENVTLEISHMENLENGIFKLYSLTGQLLQEHPVHSATTVVSMSNLPKGAYMLKVKINNKTEDWKIIKQ